MRTPLAVDRVFTRFALVGGADGLLPRELEAQLPAGGPAAAGDDRGRTLSCARHTLLCIACYERASFEETRRHGVEALAHFTDDTRFGDVVVKYLPGNGGHGPGTGAGSQPVVPAGATDRQEVLLVRSLPRGGGHRRADDRARPRAEPREGDPAADPEEPDGGAGHVGRRLFDGPCGERRADVRAVRQSGRHPAPDESGRRRAGDGHREPVERGVRAACALPGGGGAFGRGGTGVARAGAAPRRGRAARHRGPVVAHDGGAVVRAHPVAGGAGRMGRRRRAGGPIARDRVGAGPRTHPAARARAVDGRRPPRGAARSRARAPGRVPARGARCGLHEAPGAPSRRSAGSSCNGCSPRTWTRSCGPRPSRRSRRWAIRRRRARRSSRRASWRCWRRSDTDSETRR